MSEGEMETITVKEYADTAAEQSEAEAKTPEAVAEQTKVMSEPAHQTPRSRAVIFGIIIVAAIAITIFLAATRTLSKAPAPPASAEASPVADPNLVTIDESQMQSIKFAIATLQAFRAEKIATGKIAFNEEVMTPVFSPYTGRVIRLLAKPGDTIKQGSPLFEIDTPDLVQAESDLITGGISLAKSGAALEMARRTEDRQHRLYLNKAVALKDWEQAEADVKNAERDVRSAETTLGAARDRLRVFGKSDEEIARIEKERVVDRVARVRSPIAGTITARKVGPGQFVKPDSPDPLFTVANLSTVWLLADVYESDVPLLKVGQPVEVRVTAYPAEVFTARIAYIAPAVDPTTHRVAVRGVIENRGQRLKPDMFAGFRVLTNSEIQSLCVPTSAVIRNGDKTSVWVIQDTNSFARREVTVGIEQRGNIQVLSGLQPGDRVVSEGSLFINNAASS
jgi:cobalt-zinc-cadmium efflux system membrane fusion protein